MGAPHAVLSAPGGRARPRARPAPAALLLAAVLLAGLAGCEQPPGRHSGAEAAVETRRELSAAARANLDSPHVRGHPRAPVRGVRRSRFGVQPHTLHPLNATDAYGNQILDLIYESLASLDVATLEHVPLLAESWEVSDDKTTFTFHLDPAARWQDGRPVTAADVKFSFDVLKHPGLKYRAKWMAYYGNIERAEVVDEHTVRFTASQDHFHNFIRLAGLRIVPRHEFPGDDPNETPLAKQPLGSGPYEFREWNKGSSIKLRRDPDYWGAHLPQNLGRYNQELLLFKVIPTDKVALEAFKKGDLDVMAFTPEQWVQETDGPRFGRGPETGAELVKLDVQNQEPRSYSYVGWNPQSFYFGDRRVRRAMSHLFDRETFIDKFYHGLRTKAVGPFEANSPYSSPEVEPIEFSVPRAIELLHQAGWRDTDGDHLLDKEGRPFSFTVMLADASETGLKILTLTRQTMRAAGIEMKIKPVDWTSLLQLIDEMKYDAVMLGWSRGQFPDPTPLWHSKHAAAGGLNLVRYRNPEVDRLIEQGTRTIPEAERVKLFRRVHEIIHADQPYTFLLEESHTLLGFHNRFEQVQPWYAHDVGMSYWWIGE